MAAPSISGGSGTKGNGNAYTITGTSLGTKAQFGSKPWLRYDFEGNNQSPSSDSGNTSTTLIDMSMSVSNTARGDFSSYIIKSDAGWGSTITGIGPVSYPSVGRGGKMYYAVWRKTSAADDYTTSSGYKENWKFDRIWPSGSSGGYPNLYFGQTPGSTGSCSGGGSHIFYVEQGPTATHRFYDSDYTFPNTTWTLNEVLLKMNSATGVQDGELYVYQNNVLKVSRTNYAQDYSGTSDDTLQGLFVQHDPSNMSNCSGTTPTYDAYIDDFVADYGSGAWARVLLANHGTLSSATHIEVQPTTSWSSTSITFTQRFGSFAATDTVYAHVCDENNSCTSTGHQITSGGNPAPTVSGVLPSTGTTGGGTTVTISGTGFIASAEVLIGTSAATSESVTSATSMTAVTPARVSTGTVSVTVTNTDAQSGVMLNAFTYVPSSPTISGISPNTGTNAGGSLITITGTNLAEILSVTFGGNQATSITTISETQLTCISPAYSTTGAVDVKVTIPAGTSATSAGGFTYTQAAVAEVDGPRCPCPVPQ